MSHARTGETRDRKAEHIRLALDKRMQLDRNFFEEYVFEHNALPEIDFDEIDVSVEFLGKRLAAPLIISCMTGGTEEATRINRNLAAGAEAARIGFGVGSQRKGLEDAATARTFEVREVAPTIPILGNLGAVQLNYGFGTDECRRAVEMIGADALALHLNALQEAIQPEGQRNLKNLLPKMGRVARELEVPVIVKEIGCGLSADVARRVVEQGIRILDTAGMGGTSWARIEGERARDMELGELFADWGIPTTESIRQLRDIEGITLIGSGGVRNGIDVAKAIALGADLAGMAYPFLRVSERSADEVLTKINRVILELKICMLCVGARTIEELQGVALLRRREGDVR